MAGGAPSGGNTVTQVQQIPSWEQGFVQENQDLARSIGSQAYPTYDAPLVQGFTPLQQTGQAMAADASNAYQPYLNAASGLGGQAMNLSANNPNAVMSFMSPYIQGALQPQIQNLQLQQGQNAQNIAQQATQANAFGDARQGVAEGLNNYFGDQSLNNLVSQGYNTAFNNATSALQGQQNALLQGAGLYSNLGGQVQGQALSGANAVYNVGQQQQQLGQQELNTAYQQFLNAVNWPTQMLNIRESSVSNSPYQVATAVQLPAGNTTAQGFGGLLNAAGLAGSLASGNSPFGGTPLQGTKG